MVHEDLEVEGSAFQKDSHADSKQQRTLEL